MVLRDTSRHRRDLRRAARRNRMTYAEDAGSWSPPPLDAPLGLLTFGAQFAEVAVDPDLGLVPGAAHGRRVRARARCSTPSSPAASSWAACSGGSARRCWRATDMDPRHGRWGASNLGEYLVPVNADAPDVTSSSSRSTDARRQPAGRQGRRRDRPGRRGRRDRQRRLRRHRAPHPRAAARGRARDGSRARARLTHAADAARSHPRWGSRDHAGDPGRGRARPGLGRAGALAARPRAAVDLRAPGDRDDRVLVGGLAGHDAARAAAGPRRHAARRWPGVVLTIAGQAVVAHVDLRGVFDPDAAPGHAPTFPAPCRWPARSSRRCSSSRSSPSAGR